MLLPLQGVYTLALINPRVPLRSALGYVLAGLAARVLSVAVVIVLC